LFIFSLKHQFKKTPYGHLTNTWVSYVCQICSMRACSHLNSQRWVLIIHSICFVSACCVRFYVLLFISIQVELYTHQQRVGWFRNQSQSIVERVLSGLKQRETHISRTYANSLSGLCLNCIFMLNLHLWSFFISRNYPFTST